MTMKKSARIVPFLLALLIHTLAKAETLQSELRNTYANVTFLRADVAQEKTGKYMARPIKSICQMEWRKGTITWKTLKPIASEITIVNGAITVTDSDGKQNKVSSNPPEVAALVRFLEELFAFDITALEKDFSFDSTHRTLTGTVKPSSALRFLRSFTLKFDEKLVLNRLEIEDTKGKTTMVFSGVRMEHNPQGKR
jgi:hypothetical protein